jgi:hypothetical protein
MLGDLFHGAGRRLGRFFQARDYFFDYRHAGLKSIELAPNVVEFLRK